MIHTTSASRCYFAKKLKGASFSRNVNTQFNVTHVLAEFVYCTNKQAKVKFAHEPRGPSFPCLSLVSVA